MLKFYFLIPILLLAIKIDAKSVKKPLARQDDVSTWKQGWFPHKPGAKPPSIKPHKQPEEEAVNQCDDGKHSIGIDFDPDDMRHSYNYLCLGNRTQYEPNLNREAVLVEHFVPPAYVAPVKCLNESIVYEETLPTFGAFRPLAPKYGTYTYLPPQRWLHSLADGAIVLLYHPCAFAGQIKALQNTIQGCLYRHVISPTQALTPERPLALLAWGKCLQMSVVDDHLVVEFIKANAKRGPAVKQNLVKESTSSYEAALLAEAHLVTDEEDSVICGYKEM